MIDNKATFSLAVDAILQPLQRCMSLATDNLTEAMQLDTPKHAKDLAHLVQRCAVGVDALSDIKKLVASLDASTEALRMENFELRQQVGELQSAPQAAVVQTSAFYDEVLDCAQATQEIRERTPSAQTYTHSRLNMISSLLGHLLPAQIPPVHSPQDPEAAVVVADLRGDTEDAAMEAAVAEWDAPLEEGGGPVPPENLAITEHFAPGAQNQVLVGVVDARGHLHWTLAGEITEGGFSTMRQRLIKFADSLDAVSLCEQAR